MHNKILSLIGTTLITAMIAGPVHARNGNSVTDYARVTHVEPNYRYVTVQKPQRHCEHYRPSRDQDRINVPNRNRQSEPRRFIRGDSYTNHTDTRNAVLLSGVVGAAMGHQLSSLTNSRNKTAATIAGAAIGSVLATSIASTQNNQDHQSQRTTRHTDHNTTYAHNGVGNGYDQDSNQGSNQDSNQRGNRHNRGERCVTTTVSHRERHIESYNVTYVYRGHTFHTRTDQHPGDRIKVSVQVRPH